MRFCLRQVGPRQGNVMIRASMTLVAFLAAIGLPACQQSSEEEADAATVSPASQSPDGPLILWDRGHNNFGTLERRRRLLDWLVRSGYRVREVLGRFDAATLAEADIVMSKNALAARNVAEADWRLPTPSAFTRDEIETIASWVRDGGALVLIIEHMPMAGGMADLASAFGVMVANGFVVRADAIDQVIPELADTMAGVFVYRRGDGRLPSHPVTNGRTAAERVDSVATDWGSAFLLPPGAISLLTLDSAAVSLEPAVAWEFPESTPQVPVGNWSQGALLGYGKGRLAVLADAWPVIAPIPPEWIDSIGYDAWGVQHAQFTLNLLRWLLESEPLGGLTRPN